MVGILQGKARGGEEESILMHDLKPFRILISLLDKPELGNQPVVVYIYQCRLQPTLASHICHSLNQNYYNYVSVLKVLQS